MREICVVTGTRAEYGLLKPLIEKIEKSTKLHLSIIATGMHLSREFGYTVENIERDGFKVDKKVDMLLSSDSLLSMAQSLGIGIMGISQAINDLDPDIVVILGDRTEAFAAAVAGAFLRKIVCHIHGGDTSFGGLDEYMRHAITKMSHIHFTASPLSYSRVIKLGEKEDYVYQTGAPGLDVILHEKLLSREETYDLLGFEHGEKYILLVQHPVSTQPNNARQQIQETIDTLRNIGLKSICIYPNSDAGGRSIIEVLKNLRGDPQFRIFDSLDRKSYLSIMKNCSVLIGNSSSAIIESPSFKIPVVNIGIRQVGRERAENILDVPHDMREIKNAIQKCLSDENFSEKVKKCKNPYGDGTATQKMVEILEKLEISDDIFLKRITF